MTDPNPDALINGVGPRDGLQSVKATMPTARDRARISALHAAGLREIDVALAAWNVGVRTVDASQGGITMVVFTHMVMGPTCGMPLARWPRCSIATAK